MKKIICALLACSMCAAAAFNLTGCGCNDNKPSNSGGGNQKAGYEVPTTEPDLKDDTFGFYIINSDELMLTRYYGDEANVEVPSTFQNYTVTIIGHSVFNSHTLEHVTIPETVYEIQDYAFASNPNLKSVTLPSSLRILGTNVFFNCRGLEALELPASIEKIGVYAFCGAGITSITIPESNTFTSLPQYAFFQCPNLKEVTLPVTITNIPNDAFEQCPSDMVIKAYSDSYALSYAKSNNLQYEELSRE